MNAVQGTSGDGVVVVGFGGRLRVGFMRGCATAEEPLRYSTRRVDYFPRASGPSLLVIGEAPGPRGADRTGYPFWGDDSGIAIYRLVAELGLLDEPFVAWDRRADLSGTRPPLGRYSLTNACSRMPIAADGGFCAPPPRRLEAEAPRIAEELRTLSPRLVLACGRAAAFTLGRGAAILGAPVPESLRGRGFASIRMLELMNGLLASSEPWRIGRALALVTLHPSRGNWSPTSRAGALHARVVLRLTESLSAKGQVR